MSNSKKIIAFVLLAAFLWKGFLQQFLWQRFFSTSVAEANLKNHVLNEKIELIENSPQELLPLGKDNIYVQKMASYEVWGRIVYVDIYDTDFYFGKKSEQVKFNKFYNRIAPLDVSLFIGETAKEGNWQKIKVTHEYRAVYWRYKYADNPIVHDEEISNNHIIPANSNIRRSFDIMEKGQIVYMKGFLVDWKGQNQYSSIDFKSATKQGEFASFRLGGDISYLCRQFYVTQVIYNNFVYE